MTESFLLHRECAPCQHHVAVQNSLCPEMAFCPPLLTVLWFASGLSEVQPCRDGYRIERKLVAGRKHCILLFFALRHLHLFQQVPSWTDFSLVVPGCGKWGGIFPYVTYWDLRDKLQWNLDNLLQIRDSFFVRRFVRSHHASVIKMIVGWYRWAL